MHEHQTKAIVLENLNLSPLRRLQLERASWLAVLSLDGRMALLCKALQRKMFVGSRSSKRRKTDGCYDEQGISVPNIQEIEWIRLIDVNWILVIEKEVQQHRDPLTSNWQT